MYTWKCEGCGRTGKTPISYEKAKEAGLNHVRGLWGHAPWSKSAERMIKTCHYYTLTVINFDTREVIK